MSGWSYEQALFVYGSLAPHAANAHVLRPLRGRWLKAALQGELRRFIRGPEKGYFTLLPTGTHWVQGQLFVSRHLTTQWPRLDLFEGPHYQRMEVTVTLCEPYREWLRGEQVRAQAFVLHAPLTWTQAL